MKIETKFDLGQRVWTVSSYQSAIRKKCTVCGGVGNFVYKGVKHGCGNCFNGVITTYDDKKWHVNEPDIIHQVQTITYSDGYGENDTRYMLDGTGIGSGTLWSEDRLFSTEKEAEDFCNQSTNQ